MNDEIMLTIDNVHSSCHEVTQNFGTVSAGIGTDNGSLHEACKKKYPEANAVMKIKRCEKHRGSCSFRQGRAVKIKHL